MAMTKRTYNYVGSQSVAANTTAGLLDAFLTLGQKTTYYDGTARTPGAGQAATATQHTVGGTTECVDFALVTATHSVRVLLAGSASARTPTMVTSPHTHTWLAGALLMGVARSWNTYNATGNGWDQTLPGGVGSLWTGYCRVFGTGSLIATRAHLVECSDGLIFGVQQSGGCNWFGAGLDIDPRLTNAQSATCAEATTGGRYLMWGVANGSAQSTSGNSSTGITVPFSTSSANNGFCYALSVGGVSLAAVIKDGALTTPTDTSSYVNADGHLLAREIELVTTTGGGVGRLREIRIGPDRKVGDTFSAIVGGSRVVQGYALSSHPTTDHDTLWAMA